MNKLAFLYLRESVQTFINKNFIASSILLGVTSEIVFYDLFDAFKLSDLIDERTRKKAQEMERRISIKEKFDFVSNYLKGLRKELGPKIYDTLDSNLGSIFNLIRLQRNEVGHPSDLTTQPDLNKDQMNSYLVLFNMYCKTVYDVIEKFEKAHKS